MIAPDPAPDGEALLIPPEALTDEALDVARFGDWLRAGPDSVPYLTADALEHVAADLMMSREGVSQ
jgi:hypothetical protein